MAATLKDKVQDALDEARILILGSQVIIGFAYRAFFEERFAGLPGAAQAAHAAGLGALLVAFGALAMPAAYHRITAGGEDRPDVHAFATAVMRFALLPFAVGLGLEIGVAASRVAGGRCGALAAALGCAAALGAWYAYTYGARARHGDHGEESDMKPTPLPEKIRHVLTEARMVLPGAQALLGFQFAVALMARFDALPAPLRWTHLAALALIALSVVLLMTPAAYHRIVERGEATEHFHRTASRLVVAAMVPLAFALCGDLVVVAWLVSHAYPVAVGIAGAALVAFAVAWFAVPLAARRRGAERRRRAPMRPAEA